MTLAQISDTFRIDYKGSVIGVIYTWVELSISPIKSRCLLETTFDEFSPNSFVYIQNRTGASPGTFFTVSGTSRMVPAEAPKMLTGSTQSVPVDETLKAALLSILNNVEGNSAKTNVFSSSKSLKAIAVE